MIVKNLLADGLVIPHQVSITLNLAGFIFLPRLLLVMDYRSCSETSKQAHTIMQDSERRHAGSSNNFYLQTVLAITILPFGNNDK